jgi:secretion/DNA translocation related TadE-like protein
VNRRQAGNISVLAVVAVVCCAGLGLAIGRLGDAVTDKARAASAADAAALAAAGELGHGSSPLAATNAARRIAARNGALLLRCDCRGYRAFVTVSIGSAQAAAEAEALLSARDVNQ